MNILLIAIVLLATGQVQAATDNRDWRQGGTDKERLENVVRVIPSAADIMFQMGERYRNLYWAGKQGKWKFAQYQTEEMHRLIEKLIITRPNRAATAETFLRDAFEGFEIAITDKDWKKFTAAFEHMRERCMACHIQNEHAFVELNKRPAKGNSPVLD